MNSKIKDVSKTLGILLALVLALALALPMGADAGELDENAITLKGSDGEGLEGIDVDFVLASKTETTTQTVGQEEVKTTEYEILTDKDGQAIVLNTLTTDENGQVDLTDIIKANKKIAVNNNVLTGVTGADLTLVEIQDAINKSDLTGDEAVSLDGLVVLAIPNRADLEEARVRYDEGDSVIELDLDDTTKNYLDKEYYNNTTPIKAQAKTVDEDINGKQVVINDANFELTSGDSEAVEGLSFEVFADTLTIDENNNLVSDYVLKQTETAEGYDLYPDEIELKGEIDEDGYLVEDIENLEIKVVTNDPTDDVTETVVTRINVTVLNGETAEEPPADDPTDEEPPVDDPEDEEPIVDEDAVERISGKDRILTAIKVSQQAYPEGSDTVILASGFNNADALASGPLAIEKDAPILLTKTDLPDEVKAEIDRLDPDEIIIVGGTKWIPQAIEDEIDTDDREVTRLSGSNRYLTSIEIAKELDAEKIILAEGSRSVDALTVSAYAYKNDIAIVLTDSKVLPTEVEQYIADENIDHVEIVGGTGAVSAEIQTALGDDFVERIQGINRFGTSVELAKRAYPEATTAVVVNSNEKKGLVDAFSAAPYAYKLEAPILVTEATDLHPTVDAYLIEQGITDAVIIGGENSVGTKVADRLEEIVALSKTEVSPENPEVSPEEPALTPENPEQTPGETDPNAGESDPDPVVNPAA